MTLREIVEKLNATVYLGEERLDEEVTNAFASDLMSNVQTIRTCDMATLDIVVFVRNKKPTDDMIELAEENDMVLVGTSYSMFKTCGLLFDAGVEPLY